MIRLNNQRSKLYLHDKIVNYFDNNIYKEGSYNDNWFVEQCHEDYLSCRGDSKNLFFLIDGFLSDELGIKLTAYFYDKQEDNYPSEDEFCDREIEYIDWSFAGESYSSSWDVQKYREVKVCYPTGMHLKWHNNELSDWWIANKGQIISVQDQIDKEIAAYLNADSYDDGTIIW